MLAIDIKREGFNWALRNAALASFYPSVHPSHEAWQNDLAQKPVRVQWDPERDWKIRPIEGLRSIQIGLGPIAAERYVNEWIVALLDVTDNVKRFAAARDRGDSQPPADHPSLTERVYPVESSIAGTILCGC